MGSTSQYPTSTYNPLTNKNQFNVTPQVQSLVTQWIQSSASPAPMEDEDFLMPRGDQLPEINEECTLRAVYQNVAHCLHAGSDNPGLSLFTENLQSLQCGMGLCSETNINGG
jgi:hypothetical protein